MKVEDLKIIRQHINLQLIPGGKNGDKKAQGGIVHKKKKTINKYARGGKAYTNIPRGVKI